MMDTSRAWFVYAGKIKVRYFLNRPRILTQLILLFVENDLILCTMRDIKGGVSSVMASKKDDDEARWMWR